MKMEPSKAKGVGASETIIKSLTKTKKPTSTPTSSSHAIINRGNKENKPKNTKGITKPSSMLQDKDPSSSSNTQTSVTARTDSAEDELETATPVPSAPATMATANNTNTRRKASTRKKSQTNAPPSPRAYTKQSTKAAPLPTVTTDKPRKESFKVVGIATSNHPGNSTKIDNSSNTSNANKTYTKANMKTRTSTNTSTISNNSNNNSENIALVERTRGPDTAQSSKAGTNSTPRNSAGRDSVAVSAGDGGLGKKRHPSQSTSTNSQAQRQPKPGAYSMTFNPPPPSSQAAADYNSNNESSLTLSAGPQVSRTRQFRKDSAKAGASDAPTTTTMTDAQFSTISSRVKSGKGLRESHNPSTGEFRQTASNNTRNSTSLYNQQDNHRSVTHPTTSNHQQNRAIVPTVQQQDLNHLVSAHLVQDTGDDPASRDSIYRQAKQDAQRQVREELLQNVLVAEQVVDENSAKRKQCRTWTCISACIVVIVAVIAGVLGAQPWKADSLPAGFQPPVNDLCTGAIAMSLADADQIGSTVGATPVTFRSCTASVQSGGLGVWYRINGTGRPLRLSTCDSNRTDPYDTQITLFQGTCDQPVCVGGNDNGDAHDESCSVFSSLAWPSEVGVTYLLCVHGKFVATTNATSVELHVNKDMSDNFVQEGVPESGSFRLTLEETVMNDFCEGALFVEANGVVVQGSTDGATSDTQVPYCHGTESTAPGVWYRVKGTGAPLRAIVQNPAMNTQLTIYEGTHKNIDNRRMDCSQMRCIAGHDNPFDFQSQVTFATKSDSMYYILVHGVDGQRGTFDIEVHSSAANDLCETATSINNSSEAITTALEGGGVLQTIQGSTALATFAGRAQSIDFCGGIIPTGAGVWYEVLGTGGTMRAFTCTADVTTRNVLNDTTVAIFQGDDCRNLRCVGANDDFCGKKSSVTWGSVANVKYFVLVSGKLEEKGSFQLSIES